MKNFQMSADLSKNCYSFVNITRNFDGLKATFSYLITGPFEQIKLQTYCILYITYQQFSNSSVRCVPRSLLISPPESVKTIFVSVEWSSYDWHTGWCECRNERRNGRGEHFHFWHDSRGSKRCKSSRVSYQLCRQKCSS